MAIEPNAVTIQESSEMPPTCAMLAGSMMMPEPIIFTATMNVSCIRFIFFFCIALSPSADALFLLQAIHQIAAALGRGLEAEPVDVGLEARELLVELPGVQQVVLDRLGLLGEPLAGH